MEGGKIFEEELTIGTRKGCLTIIGELGDYQEEIEKEIIKNVKDNFYISYYSMVQFSLTLEFF